MEIKIKLQVAPTELNFLPTDYFYRGVIPSGFIDVALPTLGIAIDTYRKNSVPNKQAAHRFAFLVLLELMGFLGHRMGLSPCGIRIYHHL